MTKEYIIENFTANISVDEYISRFRDEKRFVEFCKQCPNYGNSWGCPPFDFDTGEFLRQYEYAHLMATKIIPVEKNIPIDRTQELIKPERLRIERELPDKVRPSLEAFGFDMTRTLSELFGIELLWGKDGILPEYLVIVSGLFHNSAENIISHTKRNQDSGNL